MSPGLLQSGIILLGTIAVAAAVGLGADRMCGARSVCLTAVAAHLALIGAVVQTAVYQSRAAFWSIAPAGITGIVLLGTLLATRLRAHVRVERELRTWAAALLIPFAFVHAFTPAGVLFATSLATMVAAVLRTRQDFDSGVGMKA